MNDNISKTEDAYDNIIRAAKLLKTGVLYQVAYNKNNFINYISNLANKCIIKDDDSKVDIIFKEFVLLGNMSNTIAYNGVPNNVVSDTLFFRQSSDIELTLLAKSLYFISGTKFKDFLQWQINVILKNNKIDIKQEYINWRLSIGDDNPNLNYFDF